MRIAYLIMTHENPSVLQRTIRTLSFGDSDCAFFIHLDRKTSCERFRLISGQHVHFSKRRIPVYWGEFSQVEAIVSLVRQAIEIPQGYDYCVLITGSCYPLRTGGYIRNYLENNQGLEYMDILQVPGPGKPISRFTTVRYPTTMPIRRLIFRGLAKVSLAQLNYKGYVGNLELYAGDGAWALTREACQYVLNIMATRPNLIRYFERVFAPDEALFHTILGNSIFLSRMRRNLVYAVWPGPVNGHPAMIDHEHIDLFEMQDQVSRNDLYGSGELLFARKFSDGHLDLVGRIDSMIQRKESITLPPLS